MSLLLDVFKGIRKYEKNICPLRALVDILTKKFDDLSIPEITLLDSFPETNELIPKELFSPRWIIKYIMETHKNTTEMILADPSYVNKFNYKYNSGDEETEYVFSNNMMFYEDIIIICYLHCVLTVSDSYTTQDTFRPMFDLIEIMKKKYNICNTIDQPKPEDSEKISWFRIAYSYPSITFSILYHDIVDMPLLPCPIYSSFNLPKIFNSRMLPLIIPMLDDTTPLALLLAHASYIDTQEMLKCKRDSVTPLLSLWQNTLEFYTSKAFPTSLKLRLCEMWGIVHMVGNEYKFADYFDAADNYATYMIYCSTLDQSVINEIFSYIRK